MGKEQQKYAKKCAYELGRYKEFSAKVKALFLNSSIPTVEVLPKRHTTLQKQYNERSAEYNFYKKEADRLSRLAQQRRDIQKTIDRYLQNEQAAKRKKNQLE